MGGGYDGAKSLNKKKDSGFRGRVTLRHLSKFRTGAA